MKIRKATRAAASLLAKAYIAGRAGDTEKAGAFMAAACKTDDLDVVMHGIATSMGVDDDADDIDFEEEIDFDAGCDGDECMTAGDEEDYDDLCAGDDDGVCPDCGCDPCECEDNEPMSAGDDDLEAGDDDDDMEVTEIEIDEEPAKVAIPASCYRLARIKY